jgi:uncharacterized protein (PEP-CTERM system associated)
MGKIANNPIMTAHLRKALLATAATAVFAGAALAQVTSPNPPLKLQTDYFGYAAGASARLSYSDNINLQRGALKDDEFITSAFFTGGAIISRPRVTGLILGDIDFSYLFNEGDIAINQNIAATSTFTGVDDWLYFDLSGSTTRQLLGDNARYSGNINAARNQRANVHSYSASPYVFHKFADQSTAELRYRFSQVFVDETRENATGFRNDTLNNSITHEVLAQYDTGRAFDRARLSLTAYGSDTTEDGDDIFPDFGYRQGFVSADGQYALTSRFALSGAVGYDEVETDGAAAMFFDDDALSGFNWRAGFRAQPGPRSDVRIEYGQRYDDDFIEADIRYDISQRFVFTAAASRSFRTRAQSVSSQFRSTQRETLDFADQLREGQELSARSIIESANWYSNSLNYGQAQTTGVAVTDSASVALTGDFERTQISFNGFYSDDDFGYRQIETYGGGLNLRHRLSRRITGYSSINYRRADTAFDTDVCEANPLIFGFDITDPSFDAMTACADLSVDNGLTNTVIGRIGAGYRVYENASVFIEASHSERFAPNPLLEYSENTILAGITLDF